MFSGAFHGNAGNHMVVNRHDSGCCASEGSAFRVGGRLRFPSFPLNVEEDLVVTFATQFIIKPFTHWTMMHYE